MFSTPPTPTSEAAISTLWDGQLYIAIGEEDEQGRWQLRLWWKPMVTLIWFGGGLVAFGGLLSLIGRLRRERKTAPRTEAAPQDTPLPEAPGQEALA
jgi:cytochrome c-type biogenesis protein CcmF